MPTRSRTLTAAVAVAATLLSAAPARAQLRAYAGAVVGTASNPSGGTFACATSGPSISYPYYAGLSLPTEGIAGCNLTGLVQDVTGSLGPLTAAANATGPMADNIGTFTGAARARANYWDLGVSATGTATGPTAPFNYHQAAAFASFAQDLTYTSPTVADGTPGYTNFSFLVEGMLESVRNAPYSQQVDIALSVYTNNILWGAFAGTIVDDGLPYVRGGSAGLPGDFVLAPGLLDGSANITTTGNFGFTWGTPFRVEVAMYTSLVPCCYGTSLASDFYNSARLTGVDAYAPGRRVDDFVVNASSGPRLGPGGVIPTATVPEPAPAGLVLAGLAGTGWWARRRARAATA